MKPRAFLIYAIVVSLLEQVAVLTVMLVILPSVGIIVPAWAVILVAGSLATVSVVLTRWNLKAVGLAPVRSPDVGVYARVVKTLEPRGYVRVGNELWPAVCESCVVEHGARVKVIRMDGLRLVVEPTEDETR
jgi:membrane protein implicated in regulation of membrane protease activity